MARYFFRSLLLLVAVNLLIKPAWIFAVDRKVQLVTGYEAYGVYFSYLNLTLILGMLADAGITSFLQQKIAAAQIVSLQLIRKAAAIKLLLAVLFACSCFVVAFVTGLSNYYLLLLLVLLQIILSWLSFSRAILSAKHLFTESSFISILDKLLLIVTGVYLFYIHQTEWQIDIEVFVIAQIIAASMATVLAFVLLFRKKITSEKNAVTISVRSVITESFPFAVTVLLMFLHARADGVLLHVLDSSETNSAGIYAAMFRFVDASTVLSYLAAGFFLSFFSKHLRETQLLKQTINRLFCMMMAGAAFISILFFFYSDYLQVLFYGEANSNASLVLQTGMFVIIPYFLTDVFGTMVTAQKKLNLFMIVTAVCAIINIILNIIFIPVYHAMAATVIAIITQSILALCLMFICSKSGGYIPSVLSVTKVILLFVILAAVTFFAKLYVVNMFYQLLLFLICWLLLVFVLKLFSFEWIAGWQKEK